MAAITPVPTHHFRIRLLGLPTAIDHIEAMARAQGS